MAQDVKKKRIFTYTSLSEELDPVNIRVLEELQRDPRLSMSELGCRVGMSSPAVTERVRRLEEAGVISRISPGGESSRTWAPNYCLHSHPPESRTTFEDC